MCLVNARSLRVYYIMMLQKGLLVPVLIYQNETVKWSEKEYPKIGSTTKKVD